MSKHLKHPNSKDSSLVTLKKKNIIQWILQSKIGLKAHEKKYIGRRITNSAYAVPWSKTVGQRERMSNLVLENEEVLAYVSFAYWNDSYKQKMKKEILNDPSPKKAFLWAKQFPEDREEMKQFVQGGSWLVRWALDIGDEEEMESRIDTPFIRREFEREVKNESTSLGTQKL